MFCLKGEIIGMEGIESRGIKKVTGREIGSGTLEAFLPNLEFPECMVLKGERGAFKWISSKPGRWGEFFKAESEREALRGLRFVDEFSDVRKQVYDLDSKVKYLVSELKQCKDGIGMILDALKERPVIKQTELFEIDETLELIRSIPVVIEEYANEVIATFPEIEAVGAGSCESEAIINLKKEIRKIFFELEGVSDNKLGRLPLGWKRVLLKVVKKIGNSQ